MPTYPLTDLARDTWLDTFALTAAVAGVPTADAWSITKRTLRGGRRDGVDLIWLNNGALALAIVPTRGMGLWRGQYRADALGWRSPVADGPVHPAFVHLDGLGGLGWLDGFDELLVRCGLESNGPPFSEGGVAHTLHGRIAGRPAHSVAVHVGDEPPYELAVEGQVDESRLFGPQLRLTARYTTTPGSNRLVVRDEIANLGDSPAELELLYHWNFGPPYLGAGSRLVAPSRMVVPRTDHAAASIGRHDVYEAPAPGFAEQVYFHELHGDGPNGRTLALLRNRDGDKAVALRFSTAQLTCFTLWKNTRGPLEGYVTGLEPGTNYPNPKPFERQHGRVITLDPGASYVAETTLELLDTPESVAAAEAEVAALQAAGGAPMVHPAPIEPYCVTV